MKQIILKSIKMNKLLLVLLLTSAMLQAQTVVEPDSTGVAKANDSLVMQQAVKRDTLKPFKRYKAEGVSAVVGEYVILDSDIDKAYVEMQSQGMSIEDITRCQLMGKLMEDKLYAHQAQQDSILVPDAEINGMIDQQLQYMISELGSEEKVAAYYRKDNIADLKKELFEANKSIKLASLMQQKVIEKVEVTPEEVRTFFFSIPEEERPVFGAEIEIAQIVIDPEVTKQAIDEVIARL
ncbi:MAG TPA: peptidylprolyl isomerase, partial [Aequorivita sp.]|nr:peptidylprolyl isomerase [Aequorivita sp.]